MSKLDEATQRLERAVNALEAAARAGSAGNGADAGAGSGADDAELAELRAHAGRLEARNAEFSARLDNAIGRIREVLNS